MCVLACARHMHIHGQLELVAQYKDLAIPHKRLTLPHAGRRRADHEQGVPHAGCRHSGRRGIPRRWGFAAFYMLAALLTLRQTASRHSHLRLPSAAAICPTVHHAFLCLSTSIVRLCPAGIIRSELYKIRDTQTPYGVNVQTIVDVSVGAAQLCVLLHHVWERLASDCTCPVESVDAIAACFLLQNIAKLRATASMAMDDQGIVLNGTANIVSPSSPTLCFRPVALDIDSMVPQSESRPLYCSCQFRPRLSKRLGLSFCEVDSDDDVHIHSAQVDANTTNSITFPRTPTQVGDGRCTASATGKPPSACAAADTQLSASQAAVTPQILTYSLLLVHFCRCSTS